jgi:RNA polymerase II-associated factor 1
MSAAIQAPLHLPVPHPHDRALLRPLSTLGKPKFSDSGVSFLRRTEYISSYQSKSRFDSTTSKSLIDKTGTRTKKAINLDKESPEYIRSQIEKGFEIAESYVKEPSRVRHPTKRNVKLLEANPLLPDREAFPDVGGYITIKFLTNPVPPSSTYDTRLETGILRPMELTEAETAMKEAVKEAYERDPERNAPPSETLDYEFFLTETAIQSKNLKRKFNVYDTDVRDDDLYSHKDEDGNSCFRVKRVRAYESASTVGSVATKYDDEVMIVVHDGTDGLHQKAAYYYPIVQRTSIRPQRNKNIGRKRGYGDIEETGIVDAMDVVVDDPDENMIAAREAFRDHPYGKEEADEEDARASREQSIEEKPKSSTPAGQDDDEDQKSD